MSQDKRVCTYTTKAATAIRLIWLVSVLLELLFQLLCLAMTDLHWTDSCGVSFLQFDWPVTDVFS